ncbi:uncharacterized protein [Rutidosis leptorrhynchoides]|uniref:uncharacterized protein n=1 Tax=Rutidosis leptorrhynchoides TaxID=125765 RepID=UPI003A9A3C47
MLLALATKNKVGFIDGTLTRNANDPVLATQWDRYNSVVLSWVLGCLSEELYSDQIFSNLASIVWKDLKETYDKVDGSMIFKLHHQINTLKQNDNTLSEYYHKLTSLWKQYDAMTTIPTCTCGIGACTCPASAASKSIIDQQKLMQFLMGLDDDYIAIRSNLLMRVPLLDVKVAYAVMSREESHKSVVTGDKGTKVHATSFVAQTNNVSKTNNFSNNRGGNNTFSKGPNPNYQCKKCNNVGHTIDRCYEIIGYPQNFQKKTGWSNGGGQNSNNKGFNNNFRYNPKVNNTSISEDASTTPCPSNTPAPSAPTTFSSEQMLKLLNLINEKPAHRIGHSNMAGIIFNKSIKFNLNFTKKFNANVSKSKKTFSYGWIIDSGASQHMTGSDVFLENIVDVSDLKLTVGHPNGTQAKVVKIGDLKLTNDLVLFDVLVIPEYCVSLMSVYRLSKDSGLAESNCMSQNAMCYASSQLWHSRLGHPSNKVLNILKQKLDLKDDLKDKPCDVCHKAKQTRETFPLSDHKSEKLGDLIHFDLWGPFRVQSREGYKYFLTIVDDFSRAVWVFMLKSKDEVYTNICNFVAILENHFNAKVKILRSDNGTEFINNKMSDYTARKGIVHQTSCPYTPQQNDIVERKHRHLLNVARALMFQGGLPLNMWTECVLTACYLINMTPSSVFAGKTPYECV